MWDDLGEYILNLCETKDNSPQKVVEIAIGKFFGVSNFLDKYENINLLMTDIDPSKDEVLKEDIINPNMKIYNDAKIIYSIRPPSELHPYLSKLIEKIDGAILIIKPLFNEDLNMDKEMKLVNYKKAVFYQYPYKKR